MTNTTSMYVNKVNNLLLEVRTSTFYLQKQTKNNRSKIITHLMASIEVLKEK
jgi:hypothetical protein